MFYLNHPTTLYLLTKDFNSLEFTENIDGKNILTFSYVDFGHFWHSTLKKNSSFSILYRTWLDATDVYLFLWATPSNAPGLFLTPLSGITSGIGQGTI